MKQVLDSLSSNIQEFDNTESPISETIYDELEDGDYDENFNGVREFAERINDIKSNGTEIQEVGVEDALDSIQDDLDHMAGQLDVSVRVIEAGAGPVKASEYLENASDAAESALDTIDSLVGFVTGESELSDGSLVEDDSEYVQSGAVLARMDIENSQECINNAVSQLKN
jgi:hypothetical protein